MNQHKLIREAQFLIVLIFLGYNASAQQQITLQNAISIGMKNNNYLKLQAVKVSSAKASWQETKEIRLPNLNASGSYLKLTQPAISLKSSSSSDTSKYSGLGMNVNDIMYGSINASIPIFNGFKISNSIEATNAFFQAAKLDAKNEEIKVEYSIINSYINVYKTQKSIELIQQYLLSAIERTKDLSNLEKNGLSSKNDLLKAQLQQSNLEIALMNAKNEYQIALRTLNIYLGLPQETLITTDSTFPTVVNNQQDIENLMAQAFQNRNDWKAIDFKIKGANARLKSIKGDLFPSIALTGGYIATNIPNLLTLTNAFNYGIGLNYNLASIWKSNGKMSEAQNKLKELEISKDMLSEDIKFELTKAYQNFLLANQKINVYQISKDQAFENYRIINNKFKNNLATSTELIDAENILVQAELNFAFSQVDSYCAYQLLQKSIGTINN